MLVQPRHDLHKITRAVAVVELQGEDPVPGILAGAGGAGQAEDECGSSEARRGAGLDRRGADLGG